MQAARWKVEPDISDDILRGQHAIIAEADAAEWDRIEMARRRYPVSIGIDPAQPRTSGQWSQAIGQIKSHWSPASGIFHGQSGPRTNLVPMKRIRNSFALAGASWKVLKADKELLLLPVISGIASLIVAVSFFVPFFVVGEITGMSLLLLVVMYFVLAYITIFFNAALISAANERLEGGDPTIGSAIRGAGRRAGKIVPWALLSAAVSMILRAIEERVGFVGRIVTAVAGAAWSVITFLVLPIIVIEGIGPGKAIKKSGSLLRNTWGENLAAHIGLSLIGFLLILPAIALGVVGISAGTGLGGAAIGVAVLWGIIVAVVMAALSAIYQTALYHFAVAGQVPSGYFDRGAMQSAFQTRRFGRSRNR